VRRVLDEKQNNPLNHNYAPTRHCKGNGAAGQEWRQRRNNLGLHEAGQEKATSRPSLVDCVGQVLVNVGRVLGDVGRVLVKTGQKCVVCGTVENRGASRWSQSSRHVGGESYVASSLQWW
jgi:hypothetical protein